MAEPVVSSALARPGPGALAMFVGASLALHLVAWAQFGHSAGGQGGDGGASLISLQPADAAVAALVERWDSAPEVPTAQSMPDAPVIAEDSTHRPAMDTRLATAEPTPLTTIEQVADAPELTRVAPAPLTGPPALPATAAAPAQADAPVPSTAPQRVDAPSAPAPVSAASVTSPTTLPPGPQPEPRPDRRVETASFSQPAARASGSGAAQVAGVSQRSETAALGAARKSALQAEWSASIQSRIARYQRYPRGNHGDGRVKVQMVILASGQLSQVSLATSSGQSALDQAALQAVRRAAPFPPAPDGLADDWYRVAQWMSFRHR